MSLCHKCGKPVYFAERRTSLGKEWHRQCLRCEECGKVLHPGQHAEHKGVPYCDVPCYGALFGPTMYGHGSPVEAHRSFGRPSQRSPKDSPKDSPIKRSDLEMRLQAYNSYHDGPSLQLSSRKVNGRLVVEGVLRVYWGVECPIQLQPKDDKPMPKSWRRSYHMAISNGLDEELLQLATLESENLFKRLEMGQAGMKRERSSLDDLFQAAMRDLEPDPSPPVSPSKCPNESFKNVTMRKDKGRRRRSKRLSVFSGHLYDLETSVFTPTHGTVTSVRVTSVDTAQKVINLLLDKFKVVNNPDDFCLCTVKQSGETHVLKDDSYPLLERVIMGPIENEAKIFIMERHRTQEISLEVAQFVNLPEPVLEGFLKKLDKDEEEEIKYLRLRYKFCREEIERLLTMPSDSNGL